MINFSQLTGKVEHCLGKYPECRNSDIKLFNAVIYEFPVYNKYLLKDVTGEMQKPLAVNLIDLYNLPKASDVERIRRKFNEKGQYLPTDPAVTEERRKNEKKCREHFSPSNPSRG